MRNAGLEEAQAGIKIARRNINNLSYADDNTLMVGIMTVIATSFKRTYASSLWLPGLF